MKIRNLRWIVVSLVAIATVINYIDRNALGIMWSGISADTGLGKDDYGYIMSVFMIGYAFGQTLFGKIFDAIGTRFAFVLAVVIWSLSVAAHAVVRTALAFSVVRFIMAFGEAGNWPGATKANAEWFPIRERTLAQGIFNAGASMGAVVSAPLIAMLYVYIGWKATFLAIAGLGFVWIIPWLIIYRSGPATHEWLTEEERKYILTGQKTVDDDGGEVDSYQPTWLEMMKYRQSWSVIASRFFLDPIWWLFVAWLPLYLHETFGFDVKQIGMFAWVPYVGAAIGSVGGGWLAGRLINAGWTVNKTRKFTISLGGAIMLPALIATAYAATPLLAVLLIAVILFGFQIAINNIQTLPSDFFSKGSVGSLAGVGGTAAVLGVLIMTNLVPVITKASYAPAFVLGALLVPLAVLSVWGFGGNIKPVSAKKLTN
jgi:ACS family hexuronate transporter-like MFS transporter